MVTVATSTPAWPPASSLPAVTVTSTLVRIAMAAVSAARMAARLKLRPVKAFFRDAAGIEAVGTSGTIISTEAVARALGVIELNVQRRLAPGAAAAQQAAAGEKK